MVSTYPLALSVVNTKDAIPNLGLILLTSPIFTKTFLPLDHTGESTMRYPS